MSSWSTSRILGMGKIVYACAGGLMLVTFAPHAAPSLIKKSCQANRGEAPDKLVQHVRTIASSMGLRNAHKVQVFISKGFSSVCGGSTALPNGAIIGLPRTVLIMDDQDVYDLKPTIQKEPVDWDSEEGRKLLKLLPPSAKLINFRIAHEVSHLKRNDFIYPVLLSPAVLVSGYYLTVMAAKAVFPRHIVAVFPILFSLVLVAHTQILSTMRFWLEFRADRTAAMCNISYAEGGVELMTKCMELDSLLSEPLPRFSLDRLTAAVKTHPSYEDRLERLTELISLANANY